MPYRENTVNILHSDSTESPNKHDSPHSYKPKARISMTAPIPTKSNPAAIWRYSGGTICGANFPEITPIKLTLVRAREAPIKTGNTFLCCAISINTVSWVLSPISARKTVEKVSPNSFQSKSSIPFRISFPVLESYEANLLYNVWFRYCFHQ